MSDYEHILAEIHAGRFDYRPRSNPHNAAQTGQAELQALTRTLLKQARITREQNELIWAAWRERQPNRYETLSTLRACFVANALQPDVSVVLEWIRSARPSSLGR